MDIEASTLNEMDFQYEREPLTGAMLNPAINSMHAPVRKLQNICRML